ncbi:hypothetical protein MGSAQ_001895, partial [marine sediment metagenome]
FCVRTKILTQLNELGESNYLQILAHVLLPLSGVLGVIYLQHKKVGLTMTLQHQGCFTRLSLQLAFSVVPTTLATSFSLT